MFPLSNFKIDLKKFKRNRQGNATFYDIINDIWNSKYILCK